MEQRNLPSIGELSDEPAERLAARAEEGVAFAIAALKRLRRRLAAWLRPDGKPDSARCIAAVAAVNTALALLSPVHLRDFAKRIELGQLPRPKGE